MELNLHLGGLHAPSDAPRKKWDKEHGYPIMTAPELQLRVFVLDLSEQALHGLQGSFAPSVLAKDVSFWSGCAEQMCPMSKDNSVERGVEGDE